MKTLRLFGLEALLALAAAAGAAGAAGPATRAVFVEEGRAKAVITVGKKWAQGEGYLECSGTGNFLWAAQALCEGDAHVKARLALLKVRGSAASLEVDTSHFGFDGGGERGMFVSGPLFGKSRFLAKWQDFFTEGEPFEIEAVRKGTKLSILINGKPAYEGTDRRKKFGAVGLRPWRATMRVYHFEATGRQEKATVPSPPRSTAVKPFDVPVIDLSKDASRRVVIAQGTPTAYKGHPTTLLLPDNKTMFCVYPLGHGRPSAVLRRSDDAGLTWTEPLDTPANWKESNNCPALYRFVGPDGVARLLVFEGNGRMRQAVSTDEGKTWTPMKPNGLQTVMPFTGIVELKDGRLMGGWNWKHATWLSFSADGGLTWSEARLLVDGGGEFPGAWPAEPAFVRSPDGKQIACLLRENSRKYNSLVLFTDDEGKTWTPPRELPRELTGDRHQPRYSGDGRLVVPFRDMAAGSPTRGHFCAWVGTYADIAAGRPGQYRLKLLHSYAGSDCGYPGLELLPDGTFIATTYCKINPGAEKQSVVSVRFKLSEVDALAKAHENAGDAPAPK